ncbi:MAG: peptide-methionine (S)-S-oxide reductase MsrA [Betaproteobacteria bacterium]|nr:peptide-methionine (S)-S-oxide reductase MsrA [Betaproteobacteria bacterium]
MNEQDSPSPAHEIATLAGGCFWCLEAVCDQLRGVHSVTSGYMGGRLANPSYEDVCAGDSGHAEVVQIGFDPAEISYRDLLEVFFVIHDPTTLNRQGNDVGTQYRSAIFYHSPEQKSIAEVVLARIAEAGLWRGTIVTEIVPASAFWPAEDYHQKYFAHYPRQPYCMAVVEPKVAKFRKHFQDRLKKQEA